MVREWERIQFLRCILLADMVRQTGGVLQVNWGSDATRNSSDDLLPDGVKIIVP
jgi:hypothetical protein